MDNLLKALRAKVQIVLDDIEAMNLTYNDYYYATRHLRALLARLDKELGYKPKNYTLQELFQMGIKYAKCEVK